jgi:hypothetical protein
MAVDAAPELAPDVRAALPTFLIIGAAKAGTTSLHEYLAEHREIVMSSEKEPMCFAPNDWLTRMPEYRELFTRAAPVRGESSTAYSAWPWVPDVPDRVRSVVPDAKIIYLVRDPVERMLSHYAQNVWDDFDVRPFDELMDDLEDEMNMPVWCSRYATQYERWAERFGPERVLVLDGRELETRTAETLKQVLAFLEVDAGFTSPRWAERHNTARQHRRPTPLGKRLGPRSRHLERVPRVRSLVSRPVPKPKLSAEQRARVVEIFGPEAARLRELTGLKLDHWSV